MGGALRDPGKDGRPGIFHTAMFGNSFPLYHNLDGTQFEDVTSRSGLTVFTSRLTAWGAGSFDFDNDGNKDLFTANSAILDNSIEVQHEPFALPNGLFRNMGSLRFEDVKPRVGGAYLFPAPTGGG